MKQLVYFYVSNLRQSVYFNYTKLSKSVPLQARRAQRVPGS